MNNTLTNPPVRPDDMLATWAPRALALLRIVVGLLFIEHGTQKLFAFPAAPPFPMPAPFTLIWISAVLEAVGGFLLVLGLFTRPVAFILSGEMAFAYFMAHAGHSFFPILNAGEGAVLYCFIFLYFAAAGGGVWSIDDAMRRR